MIRTTLVLLLAPASPGQDTEYSGRLAGHPNLAQVREVLDATLADLERLVPSWLSKELPEIRYAWADAQEPAQVHRFPASTVAGSITREQESGEPRYTLEFPIDALVGDPARARVALVRQSVFALCMETALESGLDFTRMDELGSANPVVDAMASALGGELPREIDYLLRKHLDSDEELAALFTDIEPADSEGGSRWVFGERHEDDVTFLFLVHYLTPKGKDTKLETLYTALVRGQPVEGSLKKATKKKLAKLNPQLRKAYDAFLEERFPEEERPPYREITTAVAAAQWDTALAAAETFLDRHPDSLAAPNAAWLRARALVELDPEAAATALNDVVTLHRSTTPFAWRARLHSGLLAKSRGDRDTARAELERLALEFAWIPGARERAEEELAALGR